MNVFYGDRFSMMILYAYFFNQNEKLYFQSQLTQ